MSDAKPNNTTEQRLTDVETRLAALEHNAGIASIERELIEAAEQYARCISLGFYVEKTQHGPCRISFCTTDKAMYSDSFLLKMKSLARFSA